MSVHLIYKPMSMTPLEAIERFRAKHSEYAGVPLCYAGRLDPMAEGLVVTLTEADCKHRETYERLEKTYEFEVMPGITTDTYDVMGMIDNISLPADIPESDMNEYLTDLKGEHMQPYPPFSSARVKGKPLYYWARAGLLHTIAVPEKHIEIYAAEYVGKREVSPDRLLAEIEARITGVKGEFRQGLIIEKWQEALHAITRPVTLYSCRVRCSSGTYIRSLAHNLGQRAGTGAIAYGIRRTRVGIYTVEDCEDITDSGTAATHNAGDRTGTT